MELAIVSSDVSSGIVRRMNPCPECGKKDLDLCMMDFGPAEWTLSVIVRCKTCGLRWAYNYLKENFIPDYVVRDWNRFSNTPPPLRGKEAMSSEADNEKPVH